MEKHFIDEVGAIAEKYGIEINSIFDCGANTLQESTYFRRKYPDADIHAFEPTPGLREENKRWAERIGIIYHSAAVGIENGEMDFHLTTDTRQGSLYCPNQQSFQSMLLMDVASLGIERVPVVRLDNYFCPSLLFMDVQGGEMNALLGLGEMRKNVPIIATELIMRPLYDGAPLFDEVDELLKPDFGLVHGSPYENVFSNFVYVNRRFIK